MASVNKVILIGHLGAKPEVKYLPSGNGVAELRLATNDVWTDKQGQRQERAEWHRVVVWGKTAESCAKYLDKGRQIYVEGRLQTRSWDDKDGNKKYMTEVVATPVHFLGPGPGGERGERSDVAPRAQAPAPEGAVSPRRDEPAPADFPPGDDDVPF